MVNVKIAVNSQAYATVWFDGTAAQIKAGIKRAMFISSEQVKGLAIDNCPISPTQSQIDAARKAAGKPPQKHRKGSTRPEPGGLARSISSTSNDDSFCVFIADGAEGAAYARYIHDEKGIKWRNRGIGTVAKGPQADEKFIDRAVNESKNKIYANIERQINRELSSG